MRLHPAFAEKLILYLAPPLEHLLFLLDLCRCLGNGFPFNKSLSLVGRNDKLLERRLHILKLAAGLLLLGGLL